VVKLESSKSQSKYSHPPTTRDFIAGIDNIVNTIDNDYVQNYIQSAFEPVKIKPKLSKKDKKKIRIRYITSKINEMKMKKTFLTMCDVVVEQEPASPEPSEHSINSEEERNNMLQDIIDTQNKLK
jgi:soluble cytochrome b562